MSKRFPLNSILSCNGIPLFLLKYQNALIIILTVPIYLFLRNKTKNRLLFLTFFSLVGFYVFEYIPVINLIFEKVEYFRFNMFAENYGYNPDIIKLHEYTELKKGLGLFFQILISSFYFLATPFPWEIGNVFQFIQFFENMIIIGLLVYLNINNKLIPPIKDKVIFLNIFLFISFSIYGLVVFNYGSIARYRFPIITIYFIFLLFLYYSNSVMTRLQPKYIKYR